MLKSRRIVQLITVTTLLLMASFASGATKMPAFSLEDVKDGKKVSSEIFEGKALLITFFATWCPPCVEEIPTLIKLHKKYGKDGFSVVGLSVDQGSLKPLLKLMKKKSINYPVLKADPMVMQNFGGVYGIPVTFLVNKRGNVVKKYTGYIPQATFERDLKKVL